MAGSTRQSRDHKKWLIARRSQFRLKQAFEYVDFVEDVLNPESEALLAGHLVLEIEASPAAAAESVININLKGADETGSEHSGESKSGG